MTKAEEDFEDHCELILEVHEEAGRRGLSFQEANRQAFRRWMKGIPVADSNLMPTARQPVSQFNGTPLSTKPPGKDAGWSVESEGPLPPVKGKGKNIDPDLFAACCGLGAPPQRIRLDPAKFKTGLVKKILKAVPGLVSFKAADGFTILHRGSTSEQQPAHTPNPRRMEAAAATISSTPVSAPDIDADELMHALDHACPKAGDRAILKDLTAIEGMDTTEGRAAARDIARNSGRYTTAAEFVDGHSGRTLTATRIR